MGEKILYVYRVCLLLAAIGFYIAAIVCFIVGKPIFDGGFRIMIGTAFLALLAKNWARHHG